MSNNTMVCDRCRGEGIYAGRTKCIRCDGKGVLTPKRIAKLRDDYYPRKHREGAISQAVLAREVSELNTMLGWLGVTVEDVSSDVVVGTGPRPLDMVLCAKYGVSADTTMRELKMMFPSIYVEEF